MNKSFMLIIFLVILKRRSNVVDSLCCNFNDIVLDGLIMVDVKTNEFEFVMNTYKVALEKVYDELQKLKNKLYELYDTEIINSIYRRIKSPSSILNKMKKKNYDINYKNLIEKINDIAGVRVVCPIKDNIYSVVGYIEKLMEVKIIDVKDYIKRPKKSGYSGYHVIVETPVDVEGVCLSVKVEIQIRTMAMDFWATNEHKLKYKTDKKLSSSDSKKLRLYAKILDELDNRISRMHERLGIGM